MGEQIYAEISVQHSLSDIICLISSGKMQKSGKVKITGKQKQKKWLGENCVIVYKIKGRNNFIISISYHHMYLGSQPISHPSVLQLTGQLTIMTHPPHQQHLQHVPQYAYNMPSHPTPQQPPHLQTARPPLHEQYPPPFKGNYPSQPQHLQQPSRQHPSEQAQHPREVEEINPRQPTLEGRVEHSENMCSSISKVNAQTLEAFRDIRNELIDRITTHDEVSMNKIKKLEEMGNKLEKKNQDFLKMQEKRMEEEEKKLEIKRQQLQSKLQSMMKEKVNKILVEERLQAEKLRKEQFDYLVQEMNRYQASTEKKIQEMEEKIEKLEDRMQLKIKEQVKRIQTLVKEAEARSQGEIKSIKSQLRQEKENNQIEEKPKELEKQVKRKEKRSKKIEDPKKYVIRTASAKCFKINHNIITRCSGDNRSYRMVLLDLVVGKGVFSFSTRIHSTKGGMYIGVTDKFTQMMGRDWAQHEHSIKYACGNGDIIYASGDGKYSYEHDGIVMKDGMELLCEVEKEKCQVVFTVFEGELSHNRRVVHSPILRHPDYSFVPFFQMGTREDTISWELQ